VVVTTPERLGRYYTNPNIQFGRKEGNNPGRYRQFYETNYKRNYISGDRTSERPQHWLLFNRFHTQLKAISRYFVTDHDFSIVSSLALQCYAIEY